MWVLLAALALGSGSAQAQDRGQIAVNAVVAVTPPTVAVLDDLSFGVLRPGGTATVDPRSSGYAGKLLISGAPDVEFVVRFDLPDALITPAGASVPVRFGPAGACVAVGDDQEGCTAFDLGGTPRELGDGGGYVIWLGGSVEATPETRAGDYQGSATATVHYTGI
jgi:hypothetical protein